MLLGGGLEIPFCYNGAENLMKMKILYAHGQPNILNQMKNEVSLVLKLSSNHNEVQSKTMLFMGDFETKNFLSHLSYFGCCKILSEIARYNVNINMNAQCDI